MSSWVRRASTACLSPCTMLSTPSGNPASCRSCAASMLAEGSFSDGFSTNVLPQASATGIIHIGHMIGKLNGVMPAHTPSGCCTVCESTPAPTSSACSPFSRCGMPVANSTTSSPRCTEPAASGSVLPCSSVMAAAISPVCCSSRSRNRMRIRARRSGVVARQAGRAARALSTARSTSASLANGTVRTTRPVAALVTDPCRVPRDEVCCPLIQKDTVDAVVCVVMPTSTRVLTRRLVPGAGTR